MSSRSSSYPKCLICDQILVRPRLFVCGHSLCELCSAQNDVFTRRQDVRMLRRYTCPFCRTADYRSWHKRPLNYQLDDFVRTTHRKKYEKRLAEIRQEVDDVANQEEKEEDLSLVVRESRHIILEHIKSQLIPQLVECAHDGTASITIDDINLVQSARKVTKELADYLFQRGAHRLLVTREEIQIQLISTSTFQSEFVNPRDREPSTVRLWSSSRLALPRLASSDRTDVIDLTGDNTNIDNPFTTTTSIASTDVYSSSLRRLDEILPRRLTEEP